VTSTGKIIFGKGVNGIKRAGRTNMDEREENQISGT